MGAHILSVVDQPMRDRDSFVSVVGGIPMLVELGEQRTHLHMGLAFVLEHLYPT